MPIDKDTDCKEENYFVYKYHDEVIANRARLTAKEYTDDVVKSLKEYINIRFESVQNVQIAKDLADKDARDTAKSELDRHLTQLNDYGKKFSEQSNTMVTIKELEVFKIALDTRILEHNKTFDSMVEAMRIDVQRQIDELKGTATTFGGGMGLAKYIIGVGLTLMAIAISYLAWRGGT